VKHERNELTELLAHVDGSILAVEAPWAHAIENASVIESDLESAGSDHAAIVIGALRTLSPRAAALAAVERVKPGGWVAFAVPTTRPGLKGQAGSLFGKIRGKKPVMLEELCEALLHAGLTRIEARELGGSNSIVWAKRDQ
jgi:hypothetical protein